MIRDTSIDAYHEIKQNGLLNKLGFSVYEIVCKYGPITAQEAWHIIKSQDNSIIKNRRDGITQRFSELERRGVITAIGKRPCRVSGRLVYEWKSTGCLPIKLEKRLKQPCLFCCGKGYTLED